MDFTFAELLKGFLKRASMKQSELALALSVHRNTVSAWARGEYPPETRDAVLRIAQELQLKPDETDQLLFSASFPLEHGTVTPRTFAHQLRAPVGDFIGRDIEVRSLVERLTRNTSRAANGAVATISSIRGMGGVGKTELALKVAHELTDVFPDGQLLVEMRGSSKPLTPEEALKALLGALDNSENLSDDLEQLQRRYRSILAKRRILVLADDVKDAFQVRPLMPPSGCALLVTSRNRFTLAGSTYLDLSTLPPQQAEELLLNICPYIKDSAVKLAEICGYLPLALRISASVLVNTSRPVKTYLEQLSQERIKYLSDPDSPDDPSASVEASIKLSYELLPPLAQEVLCQISVLSAGFYFPSAQAVVKAEGDVLDVLELLVRRSLLELNPTSGRYSQHDLIRDFAYRQLKDKKDVHYRHAQFYATAAMYANVYDEVTGEKVHPTFFLSDDEFQHFRDAWNWAISHQGEPEADHLLIRFATTLEEPVYGASHARLEMALLAAQRLGRPFDISLVSSRLGNEHASRFEWRKALEYHKVSVDMAHRCGDPHLEKITLLNLGLAYRFLGDIKHAIESYSQLLGVARAYGDEMGEIEVLGELGSIYSKQGDAQQAVSYYEQLLVLKPDLKSWNVDHVHNLRILLEQQGDKTRALYLKQIEDELQQEIDNY